MYSIIKDIYQSTFFSLSITQSISLVTVSKVIQTFILSLKAELSANNDRIMFLNHPLAFQNNHEEKKRNNLSNKKGLVWELFYPSKYAIKCHTNKQKSGENVSEIKKWRKTRKAISFWIECASKNSGYYFLFLYWFTSEILCSHICMYILIRIKTNKQYSYRGR